MRNTHNIIPDKPRCKPTKPCVYMRCCVYMFTPMPQIIRWMKGASRIYQQRGMSVNDETFKQAAAKGAEVIGSVLDWYHILYTNTREGWTGASRCRQAAIITFSPSETAHFPSSASRNVFFLLYLRWAIDEQVQRFPSRQDFRYISTQSHLRFLFWTNLLLYICSNQIARTNDGCIITKLQRNIIIPGGPPCIKSRDRVQFQKSHKGPIKTEFAYITLRARAIVCPKFPRKYVPRKAAFAHKVEPITCQLCVGSILYYFMRISLKALYKTRPSRFLRVQRICYNPSISQVEWIVCIFSYTQLLFPKVEWWCQTNEQVASRRNLLTQRL